VSEREEIIDWLIANLPGGPDLWVDRIPRFRAEWSEAKIEYLRDLKKYAEEQIYLYVTGKEWIERMIERKRRPQKR